jgi:hypothetical protein
VAVLLGCFDAGDLAAARRHNELGSGDRGDDRLSLRGPAMKSRLVRVEHREDSMSGTSKTTTVVRGGGGGAVYGLGLIGALVYYWQHAQGFWAYVWSVVEAILWPAFVIYHLLGHIAT